MPGDVFPWSVEETIDFADYVKAQWQGKDGTVLDEMLHNLRSNPDEPEHKLQMLRKEARYWTQRTEPSGAFPYPRLGIFSGYLYFSLQNNLYLEYPGNKP